MLVLGICGSPREKSNSERGLRYALKRLEEMGFQTELTTLRDKTIHHCEGCFACRKGPCVHQDDMTAINEALCRCDGLILSTPVYLGMPTGQMKTMVDRTVALRTRGQFSLSGKVGAGIACGGFRNGGQELTLQCLHTFFLQQDMMVIADGAPYSHSGAAIVGASDSDATGMETAANVASRMAMALGWSAC